MGALWDGPDRSFQKVKDLSGLVEESGVGGGGGVTLDLRLGSDGGSGGEE